MELLSIDKVRTLEDYSKLTAILLSDESSSLRFQLNVITMRSLKNLQSLEIKYFNMADKAGAASLILNRLLQVSWSTRMWSVCGNELVLIIEYWLDNLRRHLIIENPHWWKFLKMLLGFIQILPYNDTVVGALVRHTGASLLDLATREEPSIEQRHKILKCFNDFCRKTPSELRLEFKDKFNRYFQELAYYMSSCGDVSMQFAILEVLLRWMLRRRDAAVRHDAAERWLPPALYTPEAVQEFVHRDFQNFLKDARSFFKVHNKSNNNVVSILCERLQVENVAITASTRERWLDVNIQSKRLSVMLDKAMYLALKIEDALTMEALYITERNTETVLINSYPKCLIVSMKVIDPLQMFPSKVLEGKHHVNMRITRKTDIVTLDNAMREIFNDKYTFEESDIDPLQLTRHDSSRISEIVTDEETRFSIPPEVLRRKLVGSKARAASTTSSSSDVHEKVIADQIIQFDYAKEPRASAERQLNTNNKVAENEEYQNCSSSSKGFVEPTDPRSSKFPNFQHTERETEKNFLDDLDREIRLSIEKDNVIDSRPQESLNQFPRSVPFTNPENTHRLKDKSLVYETKISNNKDNIIDLLAQEAFNEIPKSLTSTNPENTNTEKDKSLVKERKSLNRDEISINKGDFVDLLAQEAFQHSALNNMNYQGSDFFNSTNPKTDSVTIHQKSQNSQRSRPLRKVTDDSHTAFIENSIENITGLKSKLEEEKVVNEAANSGSFLPQHFFDDKTVENFFSQNLNEKKDTILVISPTLARRLNDSGASRMSVHLESPQDAVTVEHCQNVDNVCENEKDSNKLNTNQTGLGKNPLEEVNNLSCENRVPLKNTNVKSLKLTFNKNNKLPKLSMPKKRRNTEKPVINEKDKHSKVHDKTEEKIEMPLIKRRRKLYSAKDVMKGIHISETEDDTRNSTLLLPTTAATSYRELERIRKDRAAPKFFKRKSSRKEGDVFDQLKDTADNYPDIMLVDVKRDGKNDVFNLNLSSEDEGDFKENKIVTRSEKKTRRRRPKYVHPKSKVQLNKLVEPEEALIDERLREPKPINLDTSIILPQPRDQKMITKPVEPTHHKPRLEILSDHKDLNNNTIAAKKSWKRNKKRTDERKPKQDYHTSNDSSLPGLEIETEPAHAVINVENMKINSDDNLHESDLTHNLLHESELAFNRSESTSSVISHSYTHKVVLTKFDIHHEETILSTGKSPITAHGVYEESPPKIEDINRTISPRGLETEGLNEESRAYYHKLTQVKNSSSEKHICSKTREKPKKNIKKNSPYVSITRLPRTELRRYLHKSHEVQSVDSSASLHSIPQVTLPAPLPANSHETKTTVNNNIASSESSTSIIRRPLIKPILFESSAHSQVKENITLASKTLTPRVVLERVNEKENQPSTSRLRPDSGSKQERSMASSIDDWFQRNETSKSKVADNINEVKDIVLNKIETWQENRHNSKTRFEQLFVNILLLREKLQAERTRQLQETEKEITSDIRNKFAELRNALHEGEAAFMEEVTNQFRDFLLHGDRESAEWIQLIKDEIDALITPAHHDNDDGV